MFRMKLGRMTGTRRAGLALVGLLGAGAVIASGTAMASTGSASATMTGMQMSPEQLAQSCRLHQGLVRRPHGPVLLHQELLLQRAAGQQGKLGLRGGF